MTKLYRPIGQKEYELLAKFGRFPPRLPEQPIFYPVLVQSYAEKIARDWNTKDPASGFLGIVTEFEVDSKYLAKFAEHIVGGADCRELWIPADELEPFQKHIIGTIQVIQVFYGSSYIGSRIPIVTRKDL